MWVWTVAYCTLKPRPQTFAILFLHIYYKSLKAGDTYLKSEPFGEKMKHKKEKVKKENL